MLKNKIIRLLFTIVSLLIILAVPVSAEASITKTYDFTATEKPFKYKAEQEISENGKKYKLRNITYEILSEEKEDAKTIQKTSEIIYEKKYAFDKEITLDNGSKAVLVNVDYKEINDKEKKQTYTGEVKASSVAQIPTAQKEFVFDLKDSRTGKSFTAPLTLCDTKQVSEWHWRADNLTMSFKVTGYDLPYYNVYDEIVKANESVPFTEDKYSDIVKRIGYSDSNCKITSVEWKGQPYTLNGVVYRDGIIKADQLVADFIMNYQADIQLPAVTAYEACATYQSVSDESNVVSYNVRAIVSYDYDNSYDIKKVIITASVALVIIVAVVIFILYIISKKKERR